MVKRQKRDVNKERRNHLCLWLQRINKIRSNFYNEGRNTSDEVKAKFHYAILVADRSEAGRRQVWSWSQTCCELEFGLSSSSLAAS